MTNPPSPGPGGLRERAAIDEAEKEHRKMAIDELAHEVNDIVRDCLEEDAVPKLVRAITDNFELLIPAASLTLALPESPQAKCPRCGKTTLQFLRNPENFSLYVRCKYGQHENFPVGEVADFAQFFTSPASPVQRSVKLWDREAWPEARDSEAVAQAQPEANYWKCFHCEFTTTDKAEAEAHFGEDGGVQAICLLWSELSQIDRLAEYQSISQQLNAERDESGKLLARAEAAESALAESLKRDSEADDDNYVAYLRFVHNNAGETNGIRLCNSDSPGAFKVWRRPPPASPEGWTPTAETVPTYGHSDNCPCRWKHPGPCPHCKCEKHLGLRGDMPGMSLAPEQSK